MNRYAELKNRQQKEFNAFPMKFAFTQQQFEDGMRELGLEPTDTDKIYKLMGGGFYRKEDSPRLKEMIDRFDRELQNAIAADKTGEGFIYGMFYNELLNHEYGYTGELDEALDALNLTLEEIQKNAVLKHGLEKAANDIIAMY